MCKDTILRDSKSAVNWVTEAEVNELRRGARKTRNPVRNELIVLMLYRHGLRETELCNLKLDYLNLHESKLFVKRVKKGNDGIQPITGDELRLIKRYLRLRHAKDKAFLPWLFLSEQGNQLYRNTVIKMIETCYKQAGLRKITPHMLRHGCGYALINKGYDVRVVQDYLGHKDIRNTAMYTKLSSRQFVGMWE